MDIPTSSPWTATPTGYIYGLHAGDSLFRYVGQTRIHPSRRLHAHRSNARSRSTYPIDEWIREIGPENVRINVIDTPAVTNLDVAERYWIDALRPHMDLLNIAAGGIGNRRGGGSNKGGSYTGVRAHRRVHETPAERAAAQRTNGRKNMHVRWHEKRHISDPKCEFCTEKF